MICRYKLNANGKVLKFGNECLKNWNEVSYALKRSDYGGVIRSFSSSFHFVGAAYDLVLGAYLTNYLSANTTISVYTINEDQSYSLLYKARLDYATIHVADGVVEINSFDDTVAALVKAKNRTKYEYKIRDIAEPEYLDYDGLSIKNKINFTVGGTTTEITGTSIVEYPSPFVNGITIPMYYTETDYMIAKSILYKDIDLYSNAFIYESLPNDAWFIYCEQSKIVHVKLSLTIVEQTYKSGIYHARLVRINSNNVGTEVASVQKEFVREVTFGKALYFNIDQDIPMDAGDRLVLVFAIGSFTIDQDDMIKVPLVVTLSNAEVTWRDRIAPKNMYVVKPINLLNRLLSDMNETSGGLTGEIEPSGESRLDNAMLLPADGAKGYIDGKIATSFADFAEWMKAVFGYIYYIDGNVIKFTHRDKLFNAVDDAVELTETISELEFSINDGLVYSAVKVGYEKEDYDTENGKDEFRWSTEYDTGINLKESTLEMISPYRADAYGIEFIAEGHSGGSNDIFFVCATLESGAYRLVRGIPITGVEDEVYMFNVMYSPRSMMEANKKYIGISCDSLRFTSSEGNADVVIDGVKESDLFVCPERLFSVGQLSFKTLSAEDIPSSSLVKLKKDGKTYIGYMNERSCKYGRFDGVKYELLIKSIE